MKLFRYGGNRLGALRNGDYCDVSAALDVLPQVSWPVPQGDLLYAHFDDVVAKVADLLPEAPLLDSSSVALQSPVANPTKIIGAPVNYLKHQDESIADAGINFGSDVKTIDTYGLFLKANSSLVGPGEGVALRFVDRRNDHEAELAVVIGKRGDRISADRAFDHVAGYTMGLDMVVRGPEDRSLRKSIDTYSVVGPWLVTKDEIADPDNLDFELRVNGDLRQKSNTRFLIFGIAKLIEYASSFYTLYPGDIIMTGTPEGVAPVEPGDTITMTLEGVGEMTVAIRAA